MQFMTESSSSSSSSSQQQQQDQMKSSFRSIFSKSFSTAFSRASSSTRTFGQQDTLARLPIPSLNSTLERYIESLKPIITQAYPETKDQELEKCQKLAKTFEQNLGPVLQNRLVDIDRAAPHNWIDDTFWTNLAYLDSRLPLPIHSNWWICSADDNTIPDSVRNSRPKDGEFTPWQILRAAHFIQRLIDYKQMLDTEAIEPEKAGSKSLCMHQYKRCFGVTRIPGLNRDKLLPIRHPNPEKHCIIMAKGQPFKLFLYNSDGSQRTRSDFERDITHITNSLNEEPPQASVGILTGDNRDAWAMAREHLINVSPKNRETLSTIEDALFIICLDDWTRVAGQVSTSISSKLIPSENVPQTVGEGQDDPTSHMPAHILNSSSGFYGHNRWFDKSICVNVESNSRGGVLGEHSPCDALVPSIIMYYMLSEPINGEPSSLSSLPNFTGVQPNSENWMRLNWVIDSKTLESIDSARKTIQNVVDDSDAMMLWFDDFGKNWIKNTARQPPDAFIQMAMQLAYKKMHNNFTPTYETASTRFFRNGRSETIRSLTQESMDWVNAMIEYSSTSSKNYDKVKHVYDLLTVATKKHNQLTRQAVYGEGCDRHLLGLRLMLRQGEGDDNDLFSHDIFQKSQDWKLSTSGLSPGKGFWGTGFGSPLHDGYGINYLAANDMIKFGMESKKSSKETDMEKFRSILIESLRQMRQLCEDHQNMQPIKSDL